MNFIGNTNNKSFRAVFISSLLWNTQPHLVVFALLFLSKGISLTQFFIIQAIGSITSFLIEVPTGVLADRLGRKFSLLASLSLALIINPIFILSDNIWCLYGASILGGLCGALRSGADEALFYDSLKDLGRESDYTKLNGILRYWSGYSGIIASNIGGILGNISYSLAWWSWEFIVGLAFITSLFIDEPKNTGHTRPATIKSHMIESVAITFSSEVRFFVIYSVCSWFFFSMGFWLWQPYLQASGVGVEYFGIIFAFTGLVSGFGSRLVVTLEKKYSTRTVLLIPPLILAFAQTGQSLCPISIGFIFVLVHSFASGIFSVVAEHSIHSRLESSTRATVLSVKNMLSTFLFAILSPILGMLADATSIFTSLAMLALGGTLIGFTCWILHPQRPSKAQFK